MHENAINKEHGGYCSGLGENRSRSIQNYANNKV